MNEPTRRFFSGETLQQALVAAGRYFGLEPEDVAFRQLDKRHGFLKVRRRVVIEVDPVAPRWSPDQLNQRSSEVAPATPAKAAEEIRKAPPRAEAPARPAERREERGERGGRQDRRARRGRQHGRRGGADDVEGGVVGLELPPAPADLIPLRERFPAATGELAASAQEALERLLDFAELNVTGPILQGEDRLEIELAGPDEGVLMADDGRVLLAIEHLLPRILRGVRGEAVACQVDCQQFHARRELALEALARRTAAEVLADGQPRTLGAMDPAERRIVHLAIADDPGVISESTGDGLFKRVTVRVADPASS